MTIPEIYEAHYIDYCSFTGDDTKYEWAACEVFNLTTYDSALDELFVKKIIEVLKVIFERTTFEYILDEKNYVTYILVCQLLEQFHWIDWGISIRGAWFDTYHPNCKSKAILEYNLERYGLKEVPCTEDNLKALIAFIESDI